MIRTQISLDESEHAAAKKEAARLGISLAELVRRSLRRFLASHRDELMAEIVREDVQWGLRGPD